MRKMMFVLLLLCSTTALVGQEWKVKKGDLSPSFTVIGKDGQLISSEDLKGKVVLLNFFATWCPPCRQELPRLQKEIWEQWGQREEFVVLVLAREQGWDKLDPFMKEQHYSFPVFPDLKREVFSLFADSQIPRNVLIDKSGKIKYLSIGYSESEFSDLVNLIAEDLK